MHFIGDFMPFNSYYPVFLFIFNQLQGITFMDNYLITLGLYLILMLFFKVYFAVSAKD